MWDFMTIGSDIQVILTFEKQLLLLVCPLGLLSTIEELLGWKSRGFGLENREYGLGTRHADHAIPTICKSLD
jgi:hypothetical protein